MRNLLYKSKLKLFPWLIIAIVEVIFFGFIWFISDIRRAGFLDRFFLYQADDIFRYCHVKILLSNPIVALNYYCKIGYMLIAGLFYNILPFGMSSLRIMNALFSGGIIILIYKLTRQLFFTRSASYLAIILLVTFPVYFLLSLSTLSEVMYSFFLILAIYGLYRKKYGLSILVIAFLPLIRQEGLLYVFTWIILLRKQIKVKHLVVFFLPTLLWILLNWLLLGHNFSKFIFYLPVKGPGNSMVSFQDLAHLMIILAMHPLVILSGAGIWITFNNVKYSFLKVCFITQVVFLVIFQILHSLDLNGMFCKEIRIFMPLIPLAAIYAAKTIEELSFRYNLRNKIFLTVVTSLLVIITGFQIFQLQRDPAVIKDSLSSRQEDLVKDASDWLDVYMRQENITRAAIVPGALITDKIIRRIWMYLPGYVDFYADGDEKMSILNNVVFDFAVLKNINLPKDTKCIFISKNKLEMSVLSSKLRINLIKSYLDISLYFYLVEYK
jgi:hypothetical protein